MTDTNNIVEPGDSELRASVVEFVTRLKNIENELEELRLRKKDLMDEFKARLDMKTLRLALRVAKAQAEVAHQFEYDVMIDVLENEFAVLP